MSICPTCGGVVNDGAIWVDPERLTVGFGEKSVQLTQKEMQIFMRIYAARPSGVSKERVFSWIYGTEVEPPDFKIIDVFVCKMRRKLATIGIAIETIWGFGWALPHHPAIKSEAA